MKKIYLVRHGESQWNPIKKIQGQTDIPLTKKGLNQAHLIGNRLISENIDKIYSSDLKRAYTTAKIIGNKIKLEVTIMKEFREINFGIWEGMTNEELLQNFYDEIQIWRRNPEKLSLEKSESLQMLQERAMKGINNIIAENKEKSNILVVSHGATIKTIILGLLNIDLTHFKNLTISNTGLTIIEFREYNPVIKILNDICHLKECL
ncbi:putative phosphoglycerate mutase [Keratinibaculum paraultunense]|uniref:Putative phosphoglycerate mutase n=1 Tax=Keratinibaculum paraultunense TaxID=1278232 RepID=A0A4R3L0G1_9FIRM|nr:histidine phosphatase family protein [Keratinibaculum paraultunense]QQY80650.1 histidine phosphatase family protein [Keratinibaculum paraultunense]TCS91385.1 putative phosphoglycerate mutase [Keratinibaculum paraultunense]